MPSQTLLWTALPNGMRQDASGASFLRLSAIVSPRLTPDGGVPGRLKPFDDFVDWPAVQLSFTARFFLGDDPVNGPRRDVPAVRVAPRGRDWPSSELWKAIFPANTPVRPYQFAGLDDRNIRSHSVRPLVNFIGAQYGGLGSRSYAQLPPVTQLLEAFGPLGFYDPRGLGVEAGAGGIGASFRAVKEFHRQTDPTAFNAPPKTPQYDFHDAVAALGEYPTLMRALGLVVDLEVPFSDDLVPAGATTFSVAVVPSVAAAGRPGGARPGETSRAARLPNCILPRTAYQLNRPRSLFLPLASPESDLSLGMLKLGGGSYDVVQFDVDGAAEKLLNFAYNLQRAQDVARASADTPDAAGVPALRTSGVSVVRNERARQLGARLKRARELNDGLNLRGPSGQLLRAEDVVRGYRIDVLDVTPVRRAGAQQPPVWRSLCRRDGLYTFTKTGKTLQLSDEGIVTMGVTQAAPNKADPSKAKQKKDDLCLHESLFTWDGWSLSAPRPGRTIGNPDNLGVETAVTRQNPPATVIPLGVEFRATKGTLPRMRYGRKYRLRARAVDLAGNSVTPAGGEVDPALNTEEFICVRYEPVAAPVVFTTERARWGESLERVVIRSDGDDREVSAAEAAERHVAPPKCGQTLAETHGMFDDADGLPRKDAYQTIVTREGAFEPHPTEGFVEPSGLQLDADGAIALPYLPDPLSRGVTLRLSIGPAGAATETFVTCDFGNDKRRWPGVKPWRLRLVEHSAGAQAASADPAARVLTVALRKAEVARVRLSSWVNEADLELLGVWQWIKQLSQTGGAAVPPEKLRRDAASGLNWLLTPFRELVLVHAVRRPLVKPDVRNLMAVKPAPGDTAARLSCRDVIVDRKSTSKLDVCAEWREVTDDPLKPAPDFGHTVHRAVVAEIPVAETGPEFMIPDVRHEFGDTKYRQVSYTAVATTRFREYFDPETTEGDLTRVSDAVPRDVLSSARPSAPKVLYVVPTFEWKDVPASKGFSRSRVGGWLRIYLERPWFSSGDGELLGVVLPSPEGGGQELAGSPYVSRLGVDPLRRPAANVDTALTPKSFGGMSRKIESMPLAELSGLKVAVASYKPFYDETRRLWACDIRINPGAAYFPFVRLALVRHQPNSIKDGLHDLRLSSVVVTDFAQLAPDRTLSVVRDASLLKVTVTGTSYVDSSGGPPVLTAYIEKADPPGDPLSWKIVDFVTLESKNNLDITQTGAQTWEGNVPMPGGFAAAPASTYRLAVREHENYIPGPGASEQDLVKRLVYADTLPLN